MSTYILVHGAWQGEWAWELVKPQLERGFRSHCYYTRLTWKWERYNSFTKYNVRFLC